MSMYAMIELSRSGHQDVPREFDPKDEGSVYGKYLLASQEKLDELALKAGVQPISSFMDDSQMLDEDEREELDLPPAEPKWGAVEEGLGRGPRPDRGTDRGQGQRR